MSDFQVCVKYESLPARLLLYLLLALMPIWAFVLPVGFLFVIFCLLLYPPAQILHALSFVCGVLIASAAAALACIALADDRLIASKNGLRIPFHASIFTRLQRHFPWHEISNILLSGDTESESGRFAILFKTKSGRSFALKANKLQIADLEKFLLALELWVDSAKLDLRLPQIKDRLQARLAIADSRKLSYTTMWEEELERRFAGTSFMVLVPGSSLQNGRLQIVRQLSFGGLSAVYLCQQDKHELLVLKESVVPAGAGAELREQAEKMFGREAGLLMRLKHPNIVTVLDYFVENGRNYLLLEHVSGQDLNQYVRQNGPQPEYRVIEWAKKLVGVLDYLHSQEPPILHRDLSPDNIVLAEDENLKIIDFGAASEFIGTATGTLVGKQSYMPLEQLRGKTVPQSDIYALGCTLHFLLTGEDPEPLAVSHPRARRSDVSAGLDTFVARCTDADYRKRPESAAALKDDLACPARD